MSTLQKSTPVQDQVESSSGALEFGNSLDFPTASQFAPFLLAIHDRIDSRLAFEWELLERNTRIASVTLEVWLNADGTVDRISSARSENQNVKAWVQQVVKGALVEPLSLPLQPAIRSPIKILVSMSFQFETVDRLPLPVPRESGVMKNHLSFFRYKFVPVLIEAHNTLDGRDQVFDLRLEKLYEWLFKKKSSDPNRIHWDLTLKLNEATSACDRDAEGACLEAGKILETFNRVDEAKKYFEKGCSLHYELACKELRRLSQGGE